MAGALARSGVTAIPLGRPLPGASSNQPGRRPGDGPGAFPRRVAPIRSCSRRGLPCRPRCRARGALLPHPFTLTFSPFPKEKTKGGFLSVALSLGSPPPDVIRRRVSVEPGLSSPLRKRPSSRLTAALRVAGRAGSSEGPGQSAAISRRASARLAMPASPCLRGNDRTQIKRCCPRCAPAHIADLRNLHFHDPVMRRLEPFWRT